jgi:hypothetical protein
MSPFISTLLFAASAAAQVTTSIWMPNGVSDNVQVGYVGSLVNIQNDKTTLALQYDKDTDTSALYIWENIVQTITIQGSTWYESVYTETDVDMSAEATYSLGCEVPAKTRAKATCTYSMGGPLALSSLCGEYSTYTDVYTSTYEFTYSADEYGPASTRTYTELIDSSTDIPSYCVSASTLPKNIAVNTEALPRSYIQTYQLVITAGQEKLSATAGATPTGTSAMVTSVSGAQVTGKPGNGTVPASVTAAPVEHTGAATPMMTMAPALAGLGVALAALVL